MWQGFQASAVLLSLALSLRTVYRFRAAAGRIPRPTTTTGGRSRGWRRHGQEGIQPLGGQDRKAQVKKDHQAVSPVVTWFEISASRLYMKLYLPKKDREVLDACIAASKLVLSDTHSTPEIREQAEKVIIMASGTLLSPLLPSGLTRNLLMLCFFALGMLGFFTSYGWLWLFSQRP